MPGYGIKGKLQLCKLEDIATIGPDGRDIHDGFDVMETVTPYPTWWGHKSEESSKMGLEPNKFLAPVHTAKIGRPMRKLSDLWPKAGRVLMSSRIWLTTGRVVSVRLSTPVLSNVWWPILLKITSSPEMMEKALTLWLNSTLSLFILLSNRQDTRGAWVQFKKPILSGLPILDLRALTPDQLSALAAAYDRLSTQTLQPLPRMAQDETRAAIDAAISATLGLPDLTLLRTMLAHEPVITMKRL